jgi:hypothetical protein
MEKLLLLLLLLLPTCGFGLIIHPDSIVLNIKPMMAMHSPIDTVCLKNETNAAIIIDSIKIRFCNGDSEDFKKGFDCQPAQFLDYNYRGWLYGATHTSLRYLRDSLYLLQDSLGNQTTITIHPNDSAFFNLQVITNCPFCGRMPSFPKASKYIYSFHLSGNTNINLIAIVNNEGSTSIHSPMDYGLKQISPNPFIANSAAEVMMQNDGFISLKVFDILGHEVGTLAQGMFKRGTHRLHWDTKQFGGGVYYCTFTSGSYKKASSMIMVR